MDIMEQRWTDDGECHKLNPDSPGILRDRLWLRPAETDLISRTKANIELHVPPISHLQELIQKVIHVPGLRGTRERVYQVANAGPMFPGTFDHYVASVILSWQKDQSRRYEDLNRDLQYTN